jgi:hypothetical protein
MSRESSIMTKYFQTGSYRTGRPHWHEPQPGKPVQDPPRPIDPDKPREDPQPFDPDKPVDPRPYDPDPTPGDPIIDPADEPLLQA